MNKNKTEMNPKPDSDRITCTLFSCKFEYRNYTKI